jgi:hypothetical protein
VSRSDDYTWNEVVNERVSRLELIRNSPKFSETEHLTIIYTPQFFIDTLTSSVQKPLCMDPYVEGVNIRDVRDK